MKLKIISIIFLLTILYPCFSQLDRSHSPEPGPAPVINIGEYKSFVLSNGLKVFIVENHKLPKVTYSMIFDYDPIFEGKNAGYVGISGDLLGTSTKTRTKQQIDSEIDRIGARLSTNAKSVNASCLKKHNNELLDIFSDVIINAVYKQEELDKVVKQKLSSLAAEKDEPSVISQNVGGILIYGKNHPYGEIETEKTVKTINLEMCRNFYKDCIKPNISYLAIVGDITIEEAKPLIEKYFADWQKGEVQKFSYPEPTLPMETDVEFVDRPNSVQSVISICNPVNLKLGSPDYIKAMVTNAVLGGGENRLFVNLREKHGYTYGSYSHLSINKLASSFKASADVRNSVTDSSVNEILYEINRLRSEPVQNDELSRVKNNMSGNFALSLENPQTIASFAINIERYGLPKDFYTNYLKNLALVNSGDVKEMAGKYMKPENSYILVVGKADEVADKLKKFSKNGKINYYDKEGNSYDPTANSMPAGINADMVIKKYIEAVGGETNLNKIKDITSKGSALIQQMNLEMEILQKSPDKFKLEMTLNGSVMQKIVYDGINGKSSGMGGETEIKGNDLEKLKSEATVNLELKYAALGYKLELKSIEKVNDRDAYKIDIKNPSGDVSTEYFDKETGLRVKSEATQDSPAGKISVISEYSDYKEVNGVKFPYKISQNYGSQALEIKFESIETNTNVKDEVFK